MLFSLSSYLSMLDFIVYSLQFIFHANERDILHCEIMHSLHRVCLATFGSLGARSCPCYATRFGEESTLFSRNRAAASWWVAGKLLMIKVNAQSDETRFSSFLLLFFPLLLFYRGSCAVQGQCAVATYVGALLRQQ